MSGTLLCLRLPIDSSVLRGLEGGFMFDITIQVGMSAAPAALGTFSILSGKGRKSFSEQFPSHCCCLILYLCVFPFVIRSIDIQYLQKDITCEDDIFILF